MAYDKQTWVSGEVITAVKLNHMEDGIANAGGGGASIVNFDTLIDTSTMSIAGSDINQLVSDKPLAITSTWTNDYEADRYMFLTEFFANAYGDDADKLTYMSIGTTSEYSMGAIEIGKNTEIIISYTNENTGDLTSIDFSYNPMTGNYELQQP